MRLSFITAVCMAAILCSPLIASAQHYYVVVGAFAANESASEFKGNAEGQVSDTIYTLSRKDDVLEFYLLRTSDKASAIRKTLQLKDAIDSWDDSGTQTIRVNANTAAPEDVSDATSSSGSPAAKAANAGAVPAPPVGKYFKFRIESPEGQPLPGKVHHIDFEEGRELAVYKTDTFIDLLRPGQTDEPMAIVCSRFGYKEIEKYIDYANPSSTDDDAYVDAQGTWVIPYKLERVEAGDVSVMYNVSFYKDAAIMRKSSQVDLDELVRMMHKNPYYEITVHAYCNGRNKRKITGMGSEKNYFDVAGAIELMGSAKDLTALRAEAVRSYLIDNGIDPKRVSVFSWGGSDMLVQADSRHASINDRIEIEFTRD